MIERNFVLSDEQNAIIDQTGNIVVLANPGSGKTTTLSYKIRKILSENTYYKGVIAISYTNKASDELKEKVKNLFDSTNSCFFGTIDSFCQSEIIIPFGRLLYKIKEKTTQDLRVTKLSDMDDDRFKTINNKNLLPLLIDYFEKGILILEYNSFFALNILSASKECQNFLKARYSHICIDEYQDCDSLKHDLFLKIISIGLNGMAIGDPDQSIFGFASSSAKYLMALSSDENFNLMTLSINRRCHESIISYSKKFLRPKDNIEIPTEKRVFLRQVEGNIEEIAKWISDNVDAVMEKYGVSEYSNVAVLSLRNEVAAQAASLCTKPAKFFLQTPLDDSFYLHDRAFKKILMYIFNNETVYIEDIMENFFSNTSERLRRSFSDYAQAAKRNFKEKQEINLSTLFNLFKTFFKNEINTENITSVISDGELLNSYMPQTSNEINFLTIYKAKGLEYKIVIILEMYEYIIPRQNYSTKEYSDLNNDKNVHYVAITRGKEAVIFLCGNLRTNAKGEIKKGGLSEFLNPFNKEWGILHHFRQSNYFKNK